MKKKRRKGKDMVTIQGKLLEDIRHYKYLKSELKECRERIDKEARNLLKELQKVDGWECMIKECEYHYSKYPDQFFGWCSVTHTDNAVQFVKGYSNGDEYEVLEISLHDSPAMQVRNRMIDIRGEEKREQEAIKEKELAELKRLKDKYENK